MNCSQIQIERSETKQRRRPPQWATRMPSDLVMKMLASSPRLAPDYSLLQMMNLARIPVIAWMHWVRLSMIVVLLLSEDVHVMHHPEHDIFLETRLNSHHPMHWIEQPPGWSWSCVFAYRSQTLHLDPSVCCSSMMNLGYSVCWMHPLKMVLVVGRHSACIVCAFPL